MAKVTKRMAQVSEEIRHRIATMLAQGQVADPGVRGVTVQSVRVSPDLQVAKVYYTVLGDENSKRVAHQALTRAKGFIRREVGQNLGLYHSPEICFLFDDIEEKAALIHGALAAVRAESASQPDSPPTSPLEMN